MAIAIAAIMILSMFGAVAAIGIENSSAEPSSPEESSCVHTYLTLCCIEKVSFYGGSTSGCKYNVNSHYTCDNCGVSVRIPGIATYPHPTPYKNVGTPTNPYWVCATCLAPI